MNKATIRIVGCNVHATYHADVLGFTEAGLRLHSDHRFEEGQSLLVFIHANSLSLLMRRVVVVEVSKKDEGWLIGSRFIVVPVQ